MSVSSSNIQVSLYTVLLNYIPVHHHFILGTKDICKFIYLLQLM